MNLGNVNVINLVKDIIKQFTRLIIILKKRYFFKEKKLKKSKCLSKMEISYNDTTIDILLGEKGDYCLQNNVLMY